MPAFNIPLIGTAILDYGIFGGLLLLFLAAHEQIQGADKPLGAWESVIYLTIC